MLLNFEMDRSEFENWDSLSHMQLISEIENAFSLSFEMDEVVEINKPEDLVRLVEKKINGLVSCHLPNFLKSNNDACRNNKC